MPQAERFESLVLGSGNGGMYLAFHLARSGRRTAVVERRYIGGSCTTEPRISLESSSRFARAVPRVSRDAGEAVRRTGMRWPRLTTPLPRLSLRP